MEQFESGHTWRVIVSLLVSTYSNDCSVIGLDAQLTDCLMSVVLVGIENDWQPATHVVDEQLCADAAPANTVSASMIKAITRGKNLQYTKTITSRIISYPGRI